jgi:hypothetical protein
MALVLDCEGESFALHYDTALGRDIPFTDEEKKELGIVLDEAEVVRAGCKCGAVLLGHKPGVGPRCRLCNVQAGE